MSTADFTPAIPSSTDPTSVDPRLPRTGRRMDRSRHVVHIGDVPFGAEPFVVIAGPCAVESAEMISHAAECVGKLGANVLRGGAFKPRTSPYSFQGLGMPGIELLQKASRTHGLPFVTEVLSESDVEQMAECVDAFQIGARNMQNFALLEAVGRTGRPVVLKRNFGATPTEWLLAAEHVARAGSDQIILCERGIRSFGDETRFTLDLAGAMWAQDESRLPVIVDPSHAIGLPRLLKRAAAATLAAGLDGLMVEVHPEPSEARCDADQALTPELFDELMAHLKRFTVERPLLAP
ncbi:3-deoxy-7-phosphoheptulonate synthase [Bradymonadaceae bacterium TMQ3]|uniref:3-deoxy-7-phosphoheptulonate synthase n=1 Tax=Lujinxingia sediminis TaxID=2480984 RepID=A0ABY0CYR7_9DELT|nr:3-deoxy-7-phosphoheptulonate synthase [Lujinxingia sediminis]RDV39135.1 3-deoxy-7-phosphoheptulonate synthase [Bradymonadaceae bacterium TMQ3]RVU48820.1 3-deoxy-7-phosphoheptulonate synthase [Lujinxingia sediminis]TXC78113.1 3-deoxy-7-phosphoheptulonate synthase [Bradymonadales bacterium TMQ1]